ncbi:MAG: FAD synthetase family protein [Spirochaetaceae bacterium]|nr:FAD synthetase family protein [Spirochaetaceae bacterium]
MVTTTWSALIGGSAPIAGPAALTIGTFDGIHLGHREILRQLKVRAEHLGRGGGHAASCVVLTFRQHPRAVLTGRHPGNLTTQRQRHAQFAAVGVTHLVMIDFSAGFSRLTGREFVAALCSGMALQTLVVGGDFRCGRGRDTDVSELQRLLAPAGVRVEAVPPVIAGGSAVSSTRIRAAVRDGDFALTQDMMGRPFEVDLRPAGSGMDSRGITLAELGIPGERAFAVAVDLLEQVLPKPGSYSVSAVFPDGAPVSTVAEVTADQISAALPERIREIPAALRFHRRLERRLPGGIQATSSIQEK